jgi:hypothetical protein
MTMWMVLVLLELTDALVHPDARDLHDPRGRARLRRSPRCSRPAFPDEHWDIGELVADGESVRM